MSTLSSNGCHRCGEITHFPLRSLLSVATPAAVEGIQGGCNEPDAAALPAEEGVDPIEPAGAEPFEDLAVAGLAGALVRPDTYSWSLRSRCRPGQPVWLKLTGLLIGLVAGRSRPHSVADLRPDPRHQARC